MFLQKTAILLLPGMIAAQFVTVSISVDDSQMKENDRRVTQGIDEQIQYFFESTVWDDEYSDLEIPLTVQLFFQSVADKGGQRLYGVQCLFANGSDQRYFAKSAQFPYSQGQGVSYSSVIFDPLASFLEFYGVLILAGEADTYDILGGTRFYERARDIALRGMSSQYSRGWRQRSEVVKKVLSGEKGPRRDIVLMNAAVAIIAADRAKTLEDGTKMARESIDSGEAAKKLADLCRMSGG